jgi:hypothetical protein
VTVQAFNLVQQAKMDKHGVVVADGFKVITRDPYKVTVQDHPELPEECGFYLSFSILNYCFLIRDSETKREVGYVHVKDAQRFAASMRKLIGKA